MQAQRLGIHSLQRVPLLVSVAPHRAQPSLHSGGKCQPTHSARVGIRTKPRFNPVVAAATGQLTPAFKWVATGVPLVETLQSLSLTQAAIRAAALLAATAVAVMAGQKVLILCERKFAQLVECTTKADGVDLFLKTAILAAQRPTSVILPLLGADYTLLVLAAFTEVALPHMAHLVGPTCHSIGRFCLLQLRKLTQVLQDSTELLAITFIAWFLLAWKDRFFDALKYRFTSRLEDGEEDPWARIFVPLSGLITWGIIGGAFTASLVSVGIDISPLLAFGGVSSLVVGFAAQSTIANFVSAMALFMSRPFINGDRVQLKSLSGAVIAAGVVEQITPMRTVIRTDAKVPVYINNKDVAGLLIVNESQVRRVGVRPPNPSLDAEFVVKYAHVDEVEALEQAITGYLNSCPEVEAGSGRCCLASFSERGAVLQLRAAIKQSLAGKAATVRSKLLREAEKIVRERGAALFSFG